MTSVRDWGGPDDELIGLLERHGARRVDTAILQPAELFLDLSGEDIRRRLYLTQDAEGREYCLRPEYTIPVCLQHLASGERRGDYCYLGPVFRLRSDGPGEFLQAGVESVGRDDVEAADAEILSLAVDGARVYSERPVEIVVGDMGITGRLLAALNLPAGIRRRLGRALAAGRGPEVLDETEEPAARAGYSGLLAAIEGQDPKAARAFVEDVISIAGIARVGGRSAGEIAERFLSRAANRSGSLDARARDVIGRYLAISGDLDGATAAIRDLAAGAGLDLSAEIDRLEQRTGFIAAKGIDVGNVRFEANFARNLDYYTGLIFEIRDPSRTDRKPLAGGGRYDGLLHHLGSPAPVPAVGCSFWLERLVGGAA